LPVVSNQRETVVVTGAAGGIGSATVAAFIAAGYDVVGIDVSDAVLHAAEQGDAADRYVGISADVRDAAAMRAAVARIDRPIHHVVTCAGISLSAETADGGRALPDVDLFRASVDLNLTSHYVTLSAALPALQAATGNRSVSFASSINAMQSFGLIGYSAAKAGLIGLVHSLVVPLGAMGIRVNAVAPGTVPTAATMREWAHVPTHFDDMARLVPTGRLGTPDDVAAAFLALARDLRHVSGQVLVVDGGQSLHR
jgi:NAD(P)-dependent dehydrogenase (short-subunit alcohol dehydrogenase family)